MTESGFNPDELLGLFRKHVGMPLVNMHQELDWVMQRKLKNITRFSEEEIKKMESELKNEEALRQITSDQHKNNWIKKADHMILSLEYQVDVDAATLRKNPQFQATLQGYKDKKYRIRHMDQNIQQRLGQIRRLCSARNKLAHSYHSKFLCIQPWEEFETNPDRQAGGP